MLAPSGPPLWPLEARKILCLLLLLHLKILLGRSQSSLMDRAPNLKLFHHNLIYLTVKNCTSGCWGCGNLNSFRLKRHSIGPTNSLLTHQLPSAQVHGARLKWSPRGNALEDCENKSHGVPLQSCQEFAVPYDRLLTYPDPIPWYFMNLFWPKAIDAWLRGHGKCPKNIRLLLLRCRQSYTPCFVKSAFGFWSRFGWAKSSLSVESACIWW